MPLAKATFTALIVVAASISASTSAINALITSNNCCWSGFSGYSSPGNGAPSGFWKSKISTYSLNSAFALNLAASNSNAASASAAAPVEVLSAIWSNWAFAAATNSLTSASVLAILIAATKLVLVFWTNNL